jgi:aspartyl-tRNA(Asn)/glutamyl-tRNA(Gln) amidotransferase subunit B
VQETRGWDENKGKTVSQRIKEGSADYRYFPEPDLPPLHLSEELIAEIKSVTPELPGQRRERFAREYGLLESDITVFVVNKSLGDYFEHVVSELDSFDPFEHPQGHPERSRTDDNLKHLKQPESEHRAKVLKLASNYLITELARHAAEIGAEPADTKISPERFADLVIRIFHGEISSSAAQTVLAEMFATGATSEQVIREKDLAQMSDEGALDSVVNEVITANQQAVEDFKKGKEAPLKFLIGKVMAVSKGKANPKVAEEILRKKLTQ